MTRGQKRCCVLLAAAALSACSAQRRDRQSSRAIHTASERHSSIGGVGPEVAALPAESQLDLLAHAKPVEGVVFAHIAGMESEPSQPTDAIGLTYSDYEIRIERVVFKSGSATYQPGDVIRLRVPSGEDGAGAAPAWVTVNSDVAILVRDQGQIGGGNAANQLVVSIDGQDIFDVSGGIVSGRGRFRTIHETLDAFARHFG